ncbi:lipocalin-like domain-containing protein [Pseudomaricurvus alkylphenolicus]|nr:lipocalin-like domain-containing protein [Pseudomaricurvus alkylphenolicus]
MMKQHLLGLWNLMSMEQRYDDGRVVYPFGEDVQGKIFYGADGAMYCAIQKAGRPPFSTGKQWTASDEEKARAYDQYLTYFGRYTLSNDQVTHHIEISLFPDWIDNNQHRTVKLEAGVLYITARIEEGTPEARTSYLIWEKDSGTTQTSGDVS